MDVHATARYLPISAQKMRLVCNEVRNMDADQALTVLRFMPHKGAQFVYKLVESAVANAEMNFELNRQDLFVRRSWPTKAQASSGSRLERAGATSRASSGSRISRWS